MIDRKSGGWTRVGPLGPTPKFTNPALPLSDQENKSGSVPLPEFSDEFNAGTLDEAKWQTSFGWRGRSPGLFQSSNVTVSNGCMVLAMRREEVPEMKKKDSNYHTYTCARANTHQYVRYGYFETRARAMNSAGSSAFWFAGSGKQWRIEIDVFEIGGNAPGREHAYHMNAHVFRENGVDDHWNTDGVWQTPWRLAEGFHVCGLECTTQQLLFHVDGGVVRSHAYTDWHMPMRLMRE